MFPEASLSQRMQWLHGWDSEPAWGQSSTTGAKSLLEGGGKDTSPPSVSEGPQAPQTFPSFPLTASQGQDTQLAERAAPSGGRTGGGGSLTSSPHLGSETGKRISLLLLSEGSACSSLLSPMKHSSSHKPTGDVSLLTVGHIRTTSWGIKLL